MGTSRLCTVHTQRCTYTYEKVVDDLMKINKGIETRSLVIL